MIYHSLKNSPTVTLSNDERVVLKKTLAFIIDYYQKQQKSGETSIGGHGLNHAKRVAGVASFIAVNEKKPPFLPILSALIHDLGRASQDSRSKSRLHGQLSREIADPFIKKLSLTDGDKNTVTNAIEDHPFLNSQVRNSYVVEILMDADRLDTLGAIAPVKSASAHWQLPLVGKINLAYGDESRIDSIYGYFGVRIPQWANMMWTKTGKRIAKERLNFLMQFNKKFLEELQFMESCFKNLNLDD